MLVLGAGEGQPAGTMLRMRSRRQGHQSCPCCPGDEAGAEDEDGDGVGLAEDEGIQDPEKAVLG